MPESCNYDFSSASSDDELVADGWYEVILDKAEIRTSKRTNNTYINLQFKIRDDVEQAYKGMFVYDIVGHDRAKPELFDMRKLRNLIFTQSKVKGFNPVFRSDDEVVQFLNGIYLKINVVKVAAQDNFPAKNGIASGGYKASDFLPKTIGEPVTAPTTTASTTATTAKKEDGKNLDSIDVVDDDLPF
jgi:hypothetical protein